MKNIFVFVFFMIANYVLAQPELSYSRIKINLETTDLLDLGALGLEIDHGIYVKGKHFINEFSENEIALLSANQIDFEVLVPDVKAWYRQQNSHHTHSHQEHKINANCDGSSATYDYQTPVHYEYGSMGGYLTYAELLTTLDSMAARFPNLVTAKQPIDTFMTHEGRPIYWIRVSDNPAVDENEPELLYTALHHAREPNSMSQMIFYLWYLLENYETNSEIKYLVDNTEMYFIPCVNPDGYIYNESTDPLGGGLWRKNRRSDGTNVHGVDLNRNYGYNWGFDDYGSSPDLSSQTYRGDSPFSEPETQAVAYLCNTHQFRVTLNYHTFGNLLIMPWGFNDQPTDDHATFTSFGEAMTKENDFFVGLGGQTVGYPVNGDSDDWMYGDTTSKPPIFSMTPEVGDQNFFFWPPQSAIDQLNKSSLLQNLTAAHLLLNYGELKEINNIDVVSSLNGQLELTLKKYGLADGDLTLTVSPVSTNVSVLTGPQTFTLSHLDEANKLIDYSIDNGIQSGEEIIFLVDIDNGLFIKKDTIRKTFITTPQQIVYEENGVDISEWNIIGNWGPSSVQFFSPPTSVADSPSGQYQNNEQSSITLQNPVDLTDAVDASLRFQAIWDIEAQYDFVQVSASTNGITNFTPLCGLYTKPGSLQQLENEPIYDGIQNNWVTEVMSLSDFVGNQVWIRFQLVSDGYYEADGFYFDDLIIEKTIDNQTNLDLTGNMNEFEVVLHPNPFDSQLSLEVQLSNLVPDLKLSLVNNLGQIVLEQSFTHLTAGTHNFTLEIDGLSNGVYNLQLKDDKGITTTKKIVKMKD